MSNRRRFIHSALLGSLGVTLQHPLHLKASSAQPAQHHMYPRYPVAVSTWEHGLKANEAAWKILNSGGSSLDAVEQGVRVSEADPGVTSVGYGGLPDAAGNVTLDACIIDDQGNCGSVAYLSDIRHPVSVARKVMEHTPHVMLAGDGAKRFALREGFTGEQLLTDQARQRWEEWKSGGKQDLEPWENHDTIGMLAIDGEGRLSGACTTSGLAFKIPGRVGDSPIIGAGLYADGETGGAVATGTGELVMKTLGTFLITELMRSGMDPVKACREAILRIMNKYRLRTDDQVGYLAIRNDGAIGACSIHPGFYYAACSSSGNDLVEAPCLSNS